MSCFNKKNRSTLFITIILFIYFILAINYALMWFTSLGSESLSGVEVLVVILISLWPYLVILLLRVFNIKKLVCINYRMFYFVLSLVVILTFYLINILPQNFISNF